MTEYAKKIHKPTGVKTLSQNRQLSPESEKSDFGFLRQSSLQTPENILSLQRVIGNQAVQRWLGDEDNTSSDETPAGEIDHEAIRPTVERHIKWKRYNKAIHAVVEAYGMSTEGVTSLSYDPKLDKEGNTHQLYPNPEITVTIGKKAFVSFERLVHVIAHELEHVRLLLAGELDENVQEFLAESVEILSDGMLEVPLHLFYRDGTRALKHWRLMSAESQIAHWERFEEVRNKVKERISYDEIMYNDLVYEYQEEKKPEVKE